MNESLTHGGSGGVQGTHIFSESRGLDALAIQVRKETATASE